MKRNGLAWLFFSFEGRIDRGVWWGVAFATLFLELGLRGLAADDESVGWPSLLAFALQIAPSAKRLHDRNKSGHWLWLYLGMPQVLVILAISAGSSGPAALILMALLAIAIWVVVDLGLLPGTRGENRFGPDPAST